MYAEDLGIDLKIKDKAPTDKVASGRDAMCKRFYDVRTFGAVLSTGPNAGQVRGPIQMTFARSVDPIVSEEHALTVCAARDETKSYDSQVGIQGRKSTVPYGLYVCHGFVSANLAKQTLFRGGPPALLRGIEKHVRRRSFGGKRPNERTEADCVQA